MRAAVINVSFCCAEIILCRPLLVIIIVVIVNVLHTAVARALAPQMRKGRHKSTIAHICPFKHRLLDVTLVSIGTIDHTFMSPREILRDALLGNAAAIIVGHNHPSGDVTPSPDDHAVTARLAAAGRTLGIELLDHVVIGGGRWTSLARLGVL